MAASGTLNPDSTFKTSLKYLRRDPKYETEKPYSCLIDLSIVPGAEQTNIVSDVYENITVKDGRKYLRELDLDTTGFQLVNLGDQFSMENFEDNEWLKKVYYPFICELIVRELRAKEAIVFEHQVCTSANFYSDCQC